LRHYTCVTLFPPLMASFADTGIVRRAREAGLIDLASVNPRDFADDARGTVDDAPYGGGPGMVMLARPLRRAIAAARARCAGPAHVIYLSPQGTPLTDARLPEHARHPPLVLLCGRYEGIDERVIGADVDAEWSIGDFVLSGGEVPAMVVIDALTRRLDGVLGDVRSAQEDSFATGLLDHPHYTRPELVDDMPVPPVLLSGNHAAITRWRRQQALGRTAERRPDLLAGRSFSAEDRQLLDEYLDARRDDSQDADLQAKITGSNRQTPTRSSP
jgi:tRNA (guanine37-N1)-methyltransferase